MENVNVPGVRGGTNPWVTTFLRSYEARRLVGSRGRELARIYRGKAHKRTGFLAASTRVTTVVGGLKKDRWEAHVEVTAPYAASHEYGTGRNDPENHNLPAYRELWESLQALDALR